MVRRRWVIATARWVSVTETGVPQITHHISRYAAAAELLPINVLFKNALKTNRNQYT